jgi:hypothetical protein
MNPKKSVMLLSIFMALLFIASFLILNLQNSGYFIKQSQEKLQVLADEKALQLNNFFNSKEEDLTLLRSMNVFKNALKNTTDKATLDTALGSINEIKATVPGISLLTLEGIAVVGEFDLPGTNYSTHPYFQNKVWNVSFELYYDPLRKNYYFAIIGPVYDRNNMSALLGLMAFDIPLENISSIFGSSNIGKTGEAYLIDNDGLLLSASRFVGQGNRNGVLLQRVRSDGAERCLEDLKKYGGNNSVQEHEEEIIAYKNYMGEVVVGAHAYVPELNGCVIAEIDYDEAYLGANTMFGYSMPVPVLIMVIILGAGYFVARKVGPAPRPARQKPGRSKIGKKLSGVHWLWFAAAGLAVSACIYVMVAGLDPWIFLAQAGALTASAAILGRSFRIANRKSGRFLGLAAVSFLVCEFVTMLIQQSAVESEIADPTAALLFSCLIPGFTLLLLGAPLLFLALKEAGK